MVPRWACQPDTLSTVPRTFSMTFPKTEQVRAGRGGRASCPVAKSNIFFPSALSHHSRSLDLA